MSNKRSYRKQPRTVGSHLPDITGKILAKKGFPDMSLITDWAAIVGPQLAGYTCPEKLNWPRPPKEQPPDGEDDEPRPAPRSAANRQQGITLRLRVESHMALDVQYQLEEIKERINSCFGYRAVTDIRIIQGPISRPRPGAPEQTLAGEHITSTAKAPLADLSKIEDDGLRRALERLDEARRR